MGRLAKSRTSLVNSARGHEPWLLATSLPVTKAKAFHIVRIYSTRMQIEESFRDLKCPRFGLGLYHNGTYKRQRMEILILIGSLATVFAWFLGNTARQLQLHRQFQANTVRSVSVLSNVFLGIQVFISRQITIPPRLFDNAIKAIALSLNHSAIQTRCAQ